MKQYTFIFTALLLCCTLSTICQVLTDFPCYSVSSGELPNVLFEYDPEIDEWIEVGVTGGTSIEAIATDPVNDIIYAADRGTFGIIDANTGLFTPIGEVGIGNGEAGLVELNDVKGLTYDPINQIMYGTHRSQSGGPGTNDLLFQIDVATGKVLPGAMHNANNDPVDYAAIPEIGNSSLAIEYYDVDDIAYNTYTGQFFVIQNQFPYRRGTITELNPLNGQVESVIYDILNDVKGIGFSNFGELFGTTGDNDYLVENSNSFFFIDLSGGRIPKLNFINPTNKYTDFEALDCFTAYNDLALKMEVKPNTQQPVNIGETVSFLITIYNQGKFLNTDICITNYIPNGLILSDTSWIDLENGTAIYTINQSLEPNASIEIPIHFIVDSNFTGASLTNTVEIESSFNLDVTDYLGNPLLLPDWDSKPDNENNEVNISDNEINEGGPRAIDNQDEDDHDIAVLQVNSLPGSLSIIPELCNTLGSALLEITSNMTSPFTYEWRDANGNIIDENTSLSTVYQLSKLSSGNYTVMVSDALNLTSTFKIQIPSLSELDGNVNCINPCPEYLVVPDGEVYGDFKASELIEINGEVKKTKTAFFDICQ